MRDNIGKYRGQRKDNGEMVYGHYLSEPDGCAYICMCGAAMEYYHIDHSLEIDHAHQVIPETVGEFTGLKDKRKNQDLYAGDRVIVGGDRGVLVYDELELCWSLQIDDDEYQSLCRFYSYEEMDAVEYINNIHKEKP